MKGNLRDSAFAVLMRELAQHHSVTYAHLMRRHGARFDLVNFASAVHKARRMGIVLDDPGKHKPIVAVGACPCCGRKLGR